MKSNSATAFSITTLSITTLSITTLSRKILSIKGFFLTFSIIDIQHKRHSALQKCHYAECHNFLIVMLNVIMPSVIMLNVVAPIKHMNSL
jgi:hypothetical protein